MLQPHRPQHPKARSIPGARNMGRKGFLARRAKRLALEFWEGAKVAGTRAAFLAARAAYVERLIDEGAHTAEVITACNFEDAEHISWSLRAWRGRER